MTSRGIMAVAGRREVMVCAPTGRRFIERGAALAGPAAQPSTWRATRGWNFTHELKHGLTVLLFLMVEDIFSGRLNLSHKSSRHSMLRRAAKLISSAADGMRQKNSAILA